MEAFSGNTLVGGTGGVGIFCWKAHGFEGVALVHKEEKGWAAYPKQVRALRISALLLDGKI